MDLDRGKKVPPSPPPDGYNWGKEDRLAIDSVIGGGLKTPGVCWSLEHPSRKRRGIHPQISGNSCKSLHNEYKKNGKNDQCGDDPAECRLGF